MAAQTEYRGKGTGRDPRQPRSLQAGADPKRGSQALCEGSKSCHPSLREESKGQEASRELWHLHSRPWPQPAGRSGTAETSSSSHPDSQLGEHQPVHCGCSSFNLGNNRLDSNHTGPYNTATLAAAQPQVASSIGLRCSFR